MRKLFFIIVTAIGMMQIPMQSINAQNMKKDVYKRQVIYIYIVQSHRLEEVTFALSVTVTQFFQVLISVSYTHLVTTGDKMLLSVPSTMVGKNMMQIPRANGRSKGLSLIHI